MRRCRAAAWRRTPPTARWSARLPASIRMPARRFTYSLTNNAGGRFAINATTGAITVANGALLDYETATSHAITVRVTDQGGLTFDKAFTIARDQRQRGAGELCARQRDASTPTPGRWSASTSIVDPDYSAGSMTTTISTVQRTPLSGSIRAPARALSGNVTDMVTLSGTVDQINATLGSLSYRGAQDRFGE